MIAPSSPLAAYYKPKPYLNVWQWAAKHVDYSRVPRYETPRRSGKFDPDWLPYWKQPAEWATDPTIRQVVILKCSRAGATESVLNVIRYHVARDPIPILYVGGQSDLVELFHKERIALGMRLSPETEDKYNAAQCAGTAITFEDMLLNSTYPGSKTATKQTGWPLIVLDEFDMYPEYSGAMFDKRIGTYQFGHIIKISSPDPQQKRSSDESPIFMEFFGDKDKGYGATDQCYWMMPDPRTGQPFKFKLSVNGEDEYGLKWDNGAKRDNGRWDMKRVKETAHFVTPSCAVITNADKMGLVAKGQWVPSNPDADPTKRGVHLNAMYTPFPDGDFGTVAVKFLTAKAQGAAALRVFVYEYLAEKWVGESVITELSDIDNRKAEYLHGQRISTVEAYAPLFKARKSGLIAPIDVQRDRMRVIIREYIFPGDSGLVFFGWCNDWRAVKEVMAKYGVKTRPFIDCSYAERRTEVMEQCLFGEMRGAVPVFGRENAQDAITIKKRDPFEGTARQGREKLPMVTMNPDQLKHQLLKLVHGIGPHKFYVPKDIDPEYTREMMCEKLVDNEFVPQHKDNHSWDCEYMGLGGAMCYGLFVQAYTAEDVKLDEEKEIPEKSANSEQSKPVPRAQMRQITYE